MATLKLVLDQRRKRKDNLYPLVIRLSHKSKTRDLPTNVKLKPNQFNSKSCKVMHDAELNDKMTKLLLIYSSQTRDFINDVLECSVQEIKDYLTTQNLPVITIKEFWLEEIERLIINNHEGGAHVYKGVLSAIENEINLNTSFRQLSYQGLMQLESALYKRGMTTNGVSVYMRTLRAICNKAIYYDLVGHDWYPFRKYKIRKAKTTPRVLTIEEMKAYFNLNLPVTHAYYKTWLIGKLIFMLRGINIKDLLLLSSDNVKNGRIIYKRAKTGKIYSINYSDEVKNILNEFEINNTLLGVIKDKDFKNKEKLVKTIAQHRKVINSHLKKIGKTLNTEEPITTYVFRYSYANIAKRLGYSKDLIGEALGHNVGSIITGIYLENYDLEVLDDMNDKIISTIISPHL